MGVLNPSQLEIMKLFESHKTEEDLKKLKKALIKYLYERAADAADKAFDERGYTEDTIEQWKNEKMRRKTAVA
jgi:hypothetical protein